MSLIEHVLGLTKDEASSRLREAGYQVRIVNLDGPPARMIENHDIGRVTLEVTAGKVVAVRIG